MPNPFGALDLVRYGALLTSSTSGWRLAIPAVSTDHCSHWEQMVNRGMFAWPARMVLVRTTQVVYLRRGDARFEIPVGDILPDIGKIPPVQTFELMAPFGTIITAELWT